MSSPPMTERVKKVLQLFVKPTSDIYILHMYITNKTVNDVMDDFDFD